MIEATAVESRGRISMKDLGLWEEYQMEVLHQIVSFAKSQAEEILGNNRDDLIFLGRELLRNPYWVLDAAKDRKRDYIGPKQYARAF
nr:hypothetical protein [Thermoflavimicrobium daqui]